MSYEIDKVTTHTCPCGVGKYQVIHRSNDWNQTNESWEMLCKDCKEKYVLKSKVKYDSGLSYWSYEWISHEEIRKEEEKEKYRSQAVDLAKKRYLDAFTSRFDGFSKKRIWETLEKEIGYTNSLSSFYKDLRHYGSTKRYMASLIGLRIERIFPNLISDPEILDLLEKSK